MLTLTRTRPQNSASWKCQYVPIFFFAIHTTHMPWKENLISHLLNGCYRPSTPYNPKCEEMVRGWRPLKSVVHSNTSSAHSASPKPLKGGHELRLGQELHQNGAGDKTYRNKTSTRALMFPNTYTDQILSLILLVLKQWTAIFSLRIKTEYPKGTQRAHS